jgi:uncharacterized protein
MVRPKHGSLNAIILATFLPVLLALACSSVTATPVAPGKYFIWRVTNVPVPFYLIGSIHNLSARDYPLPEVYRTALTNSQRLLFECSPREQTALTQKFRQAARYPIGQDIESELRPEVVGLIKKNEWRLRMKFDQLRHYRPWAIGLMLLAEQGPVGPSSPRSMDNYLSREAQRAGKEVAGLETVDEHVAFWREMLERDGENLLLYTLTHKETVGLLLDKTRETWKRGDVAGLSATNARLRRANPAIAQRLLDRRNARWVTRIEAEMQTGKPTAIVAGAGHFSGRGSVIALLKEHGYTLEQL